MKISKQKPQIDGYAGNLIFKFCNRKIYVPAMPVSTKILHERYRDTYCWELFYHLLHFVRPYMLHIGIIGTLILIFIYLFLYAGKSNNKIKIGISIKIPCLHDHIMM